MTAVERRDRSGNLIGPNPDLVGPELSAMYSRSLDHIRALNNDPRVISSIEHDHLQPARHISVEEQLAIFLKIVGENAVVSHRRFQHSGDTISRIFNDVLDAILKPYPKVVKQPSNDIFQYAYEMIPKRIHILKDPLPTLTHTNTKRYVFEIGKVTSVKCSWDMSIR